MLASCCEELKDPQKPLSRIERITMVESLGLTSGYEENSSTLHPSGCEGFSRTIM